MEMSREEKKLVDKALYKYPRWKRIRQTVIEEMQWIESVQSRSTTDYSAVAELGTRIQATPRGESPQERILDAKERRLRGQLDYADLLQHRITRIDRALEDLDENTQLLCHQRYFQRKSMDQCLASLQGLSRNGYAQGIAEIREAVAPYVLGVFSDAA